FFDHFFPVLGSCFGFGVLGIFFSFCCFVHSADFSNIGAAVLSQHVDGVNIVSLFVLSCMNMLLGLIFRGSAKCRC
ncbi:hypothetical protein DEU56DRAFT_748335, partial [Suillus clintonianus]|uniref:uncharacterized protein n=1 Tax=Suillus clintonianus TaxID=1904413 RepID=UPI001B878B65